MRAQSSCVIPRSVLVAARHLDQDGRKALAIYLVLPDTIYRVLDRDKGSRVGPWETDWTRRDRSFHVDTRREPPRPAALPDRQENTMSKRGRKRRSRKGNAANHGKRPNA
ncbi:hypothetical protein B8281_09105 [Cellulosimicrobium sp. TH-20]|nr:hypothetical protein B8281_09105 [Cellulosimicrobium sp. TH-20]